MQLLTACSQTDDLCDAYSHVENYTGKTGLLTFMVYHCINAATQICTLF